MDTVETVIETEEAVRIVVSEWDDGAWISLRTMNGGMHTSLTREEAQKLIVALQDQLKAGEGK